jgi:hypothetical protein
MGNTKGLEHADTASPTKGWAWKGESKTRPKRSESESEMNVNKAYPVLLKIAQTNHEFLFVGVEVYVRWILPFFDVGLPNVRSFSLRCDSSIPGAMSGDANGLAEEKLEYVRDL